MAKLEIISENTKDTIEMILDRYLIGKSKPSVDIQLDNEAVSRRHAEIVKKGSSYLVRDLKSRNHTFVNRIQVREKELADQDIITIRPFHLKFIDNNKEGQSSLKMHGYPDAKKNISRGGAARDETAFDIKKVIHMELIKRMDLKKTNLEQLDEIKLKSKVQGIIHELLREYAETLSDDVDKPVLEKELMDDILGFGPLEDLINNTEITEIMVNNKDQIYFEKKGKLFTSDKRFYDDGHVLRIIEKIVSETGKSINESNPIVDTRLVSDGSRINAIIPPLAINGPCLTIRKFSQKMLSPDDLINFGSLSKNMLEFLQLCVLQRKNIIVSGGTGSGKTTLLNLLSSFIPQDERIITVEDAAELHLQQEHVITLEARPPNLEGKGAITIRDLVKNCLRMRPDRIIVGECRGPEALDVLQAMNTGHDGSLTTAHANTPRDVLTRMETMVLMTGMDMPLKAIRNQIDSAIDIVIQQSRFQDGTRKITHITEITGMEQEIISTQDIFTFKQAGFSSEGKVEGEFKATGIVPSFIDDLKGKGVEINYDLFSEA